MVKVLAIFTCYNRKEKTQYCLDSLIEGEPNVEFSFLAVDDKSTDGTRQMLDRYVNVQTISTEGNCFYSGGMRFGIQRAKEQCEEFEWVLLLNDDVKFYPHSIERLLHLSAEKKEILVGATCDEKGALSYGGVLCRSRFKPDFAIVMSDKERQSCDTFNGNCVLIPADIFKKLPNIDAAYTHSLGDFDYGLEAHKRGIRIVASDFFVGECKDNLRKGTWRDTSLPRRERIRRKEEAKGLPAGEWFYFVKKHFGFFPACYSSITPFVRILLGI